MLKVGRFILIAVIAAGVISLIGRIFFDFDLPPDDDPYDLWRGLGVWATAILIAVFDLLRSRSRG